MRKKTILYIDDLKKNILEDVRPGCFGMLTLIQSRNETKQKLLYGNYLLYKRRMFVCVSVCLSVCPDVVP